ILEQAEPLRHIADLALDLHALVAQVEAENMTLAFVRDEQSADHPQGRRLARAIRPEEAAYPPLGQAQVEMIDDRAPAKSLGEAMHVNGRRGVHDPLAGSISTGRPKGSGVLDGARPASTRNTSLARAPSL